MLRVAHRLASSSTPPSKRHFHHLNSRGLEPYDIDDVDPAADLCPKGEDRDTYAFQLLRQCLLAAGPPHTRRPRRLALRPRKLTSKLGFSVNRPRAGLSHLHPCTFGVNIEPFSREIGWKHRHFHIKRAGSTQQDDMQDRPNKPNKEDIAAYSQDTRR